MNAMPTFTILRNKMPTGTIRAVSYAQAHKRACAIYGRCEVLANGDTPMDRKGRAADSFTHGRSPYPCPGFEERRRALIEAHKANA